VRESDYASHRHDLGRFFPKNRLLLPFARLHAKTRDIDDAFPADDRFSRTTSVENRDTEADIITAKNHGVKVMVGAGICDQAQLELWLPDLIVKKSQRAVI